MTSSDLTRLPVDAKARAAARVGTSVGDSAGPVSGDGIRLAFACAEFNGGITDRLLTSGLDTVVSAGGDLDSVVVAWAPGAFELPLLARRLAGSGLVDAVICLGAVIRGDTSHYELISGECARGLQRVQLDFGLPIVFGVLTTDTADQALLRSEDDETNKGREAVLTGMEMVRTMAAIPAGKVGSC